MKLSSFIPPLILALVTVVSCKKTDEFSKADIISGDAEYAIPLFSSQITPEKLLNNFDDLAFIEVDQEGVLHLRYTGDVLSQSADEFLAAARDSVPPLIPMVNTNYMPLPFSSPEQLEIDYAVYKTGEVSLAVESDYQGMIDLTVTLPQVSKNGQPLTLELQFESPTSSPLGPIQFFEQETKVDVSGYILEPENDSIYVSYEAINEEGESIVLPIVALVNKNIYFSYIEGYLGNFKHNGDKDTIYIDFFESWIQGDVFFEEPEILIHVENSFGVPTRSVIETFDILTADNQRIPLQSPFIDDENGIDFAYPTEVGEVETMTFRFNEGNSNIEQVLSSRPIALDYDVDARMNPDSVVDLRGFITDSSYYNIQVEVDLPLHGMASNFGITDSYDVNFTGYEDISEVEFKIVADNGMPLDIDAQIYFLDSTGVVLDSLFSDGKTRIIGSAEVDASGEVIFSNSNTTFATFSSGRFENIRTAAKLTLNAFFSTFNEGQHSVKVYKDQEADIRLGMKLRSH